MRPFGVRSKLAQEFSGFTGTAKEFRNLFAGREKAAGQYHNIYYADDIRYARLRLMNLPPDAARAPRVPPIINCRMSKGGVGKTVLCGNVAAALAMFGHRVLMIDGDPQASLTGLFGINWANEDITHVGELMYKFLKKEPCDLEAAVRPLYPDRMLDLIASDITLANTDTWLMGATNREFLFKKFLEANAAVFGRYDAILIDSAPSTNLLTNAFMCASQKILAVVWLDGQSLKAMQVLASNVAELNAAFSDQGFHLDVHIVANGYHPSYGSCKDALSTLASTYRDQLSDVVIPHASSFMRQVELFKEEQSGPAIEREPSSTAARAVIDLAKTLVKEYDIRIADQAVV